MKEERRGMLQGKDMEGGVGLILTADFRLCCLYPCMVGWELKIRRNLWVQIQCIYLVGFWACIPRASMPLTSVVCGSYMQITAFNLRVSPCFALPFLALPL